MLGTEVKHVENLDEELECRMLGIKIKHCFVRLRFIYTRAKIALSWWF